MGTVALFRAWR